MPLLRDADSFKSEKYRVFGLDCLALELNGLVMLLSVLLLLFSGLFWSIKIWSNLRFLVEFEAVVELGLCIQFSKWSKAYQQYSAWHGYFCSENPTTLITNLFFFFLKDIDNQSWKFILLPMSKFYPNSLCLHKGLILSHSSRRCSKVSTCHPQFLSNACFNLPSIL